MPFHHQTAKNISSKKKTNELFELSACHLVEQTRFQDNAVISEDNIIGYYYWIYYPIIIGYKYLIYNAIIIG